MSRIFKVLLPSCWLLVFSCSSGSSSRASPIDAFSGEPDVPLQPAERRTPPPLERVARRKRPILRRRAGPSRRAGPRWMAEWIPTGALLAIARHPAVRRHQPARLDCGTTSTGGATASGGVDAGTGSGTCGDGDPNLPPEPTIPPAARPCQQPKAFPLEASRVKPVLTPRPSKRRSRMRLGTGGQAHHGRCEQCVCHWTAHAAFGGNPVGGRRHDTLRNTRHKSVGLGSALIQ